MKVQFKRGYEKNLPLQSDEGTLLFATDTGRIFEGKGLNNGLLKYSDILGGYENKADLELQNPKIKEKLFITNNNEVYYYSEISDSYIQVGSTVSLPYDYLEKFFDNNNTNGQLLKILDFNMLAQENKIRSIVNSEIIIKNLSQTQDLILKVLDRNIEVANVTIKPSETQKYILGIGLNTKVFVQGLFDSNFYMNYYKSD